MYFDGYSRLGWVYDSNDEPVPYYEIYPWLDGDVKRYFVNETDEMISDIRKVLNDRR